MYKEINGSTVGMALALTGHTFGFSALEIFTIYVGIILTILSAGFLIQRLSK